MKFVLYSLLFIAIAISSCSICNAQGLWELEKLNNKVNTSQYDELSPVISRDGNTLYFTRVADPLNSRILIEKGVDYSYHVNPSKYDMKMKYIFGQLEGRTIQNPMDSDFNQDVWMAQSEIFEFDKVSRPDYPLNSALPNSLCSLTPHDRTFVVINQFTEDGQMRGGFSTIKQMLDGKWEFPKPLAITSFYTSSPDVSLSMTANGDIMIMSVRRDDSRGDNDLYLVKKEGDFIWSNPVNLGSRINSSGREVAPFITEDGNYLYFASNRGGGHGGMDIYRSERIDGSWLNWKEPELMPEPINTPYDDSQPFFNQATGHLYFCSKRDGSSDVFRSRVKTPEPYIVNIKGSVINAFNNEKISAKVFVSSTSRQSIEYIAQSEDGNFEFAVPKSSNYEIFARKDGFLGDKKLVSTKMGRINKQDLVVNLLMDPIELESYIKISPVYFKKSTAKVLKESYKELDRIAQILKEHEGIHVAIEGHTDNVGDKQLLRDLSRARAKTIKKYLVREGKIPSFRITTEGFGDSKPVSKNRSEDGRALNRRVEVRITKVNEVN